MVERHFYAHGDTAMNLNALMLIPHDQIDYTSLDADTLRGLATQNSEPYIATSALAELGARAGHEARAAAVTILSTELWDRHLFAFAITTLCDIDCEEAARTMPRLLDVTSDAKVLGAMVECVLSHPDNFSSDSGQEILGRLATKVARVDPDEFTDAEERTAFLARYRRRAGTHSDDPHE